MHHCLRISRFLEESKRPFRRTAPSSYSILRSERPPLALYICRCHRRLASSPRTISKQSPIAHATLGLTVLGTLGFRRTSGSGTSAFVLRTLNTTPTLFIQSTPSTDCTSWERRTLATQTSVYDFESAEFSPPTYISPRLLTIRSTLR